MYRTAPEAENKNYHGESEVKQGRPSERVRQAVYELGEHSGDVLAQGKVGEDSHHHHEHDRVLQHLHGKTP